jgi:hypothetical protein
MGIEAADQATQDAVALILALLNDNAAAFKEILGRYDPPPETRDLVVSLVALANRLAEEQGRTAEELQADLTAFAIDIGSLRHPGIRRPDESESASTSPAQVSSDATIHSAVAASMAATGIGDSRSDSALGGCSV